MTTVRVKGGTSKYMKQGLLTDSPLLSLTYTTNILKAIRECCGTRKKKGRED